MRPLLAALTALLLLAADRPARAQLIMLSLKDGTARAGFLVSLNQRQVSLRVNKNSPVTSHRWSDIAVARTEKFDFTLDPGTGKLARQAVPQGRLRLMGEARATAHWSAGGEALGALYLVVPDEVLFMPKGAPQIKRYPAREVASIDYAAGRVAFDAASGELVKSPEAPKPPGAPAGTPEAGGPRGGGPPPGEAPQKKADSPAEEEGAPEFPLLLAVGAVVGALVLYGLYYHLFRAGR